MRIVALFITLLSVLLVACNKDEYAENAKSSNEFPDSPGDYWKYGIYSLTGRSEGILMVRVISKSVLPFGQSVSTWVYTYPGFTDTVYMLTDGSNIEEYNHFPGLTENNVPIMRYNFPLETGKKWAISNSLSSDSVLVNSETSVSVPAGSFSDSWQLDFIGTRYIGNYRNNSLYWFTPNIGITRMLFSVISLSADKRNGTYELLEYHLK